MNDVQKLSMCRICLVGNVRTFVVANNNLQAIYEMLTDIPLLTKDRRPMLACFLCYNRLKQCYQLQRKCLEAEKLFARILNEDYEAKPLLDRGHLEFSGYIISPIEQINISADCQPESGHVINENIPADCEGHDDNVELKEEHQSDSEQEIPVIEYLNIYSDREDLLPQLESGLILPHHSESDSDATPLMEFKTEKEEEQEVSKKKRRAKKTTRAPGVKETKLDSRRAKPEETLTTQLKNTKEQESNIIQKTQNRTTEPVTEIKKSSSNSNDLNNHIRVHTGENPFKCDVCQRSFKHKSRLKTHMTVHTQNPYNCDVCQSSFSQKSSLTRHILVHTGELPYKCEVCQHSFAKKCDLTRHSLVHTGEKPFKCDVCQRSFIERNKLTNHMRVHTGEKPFRCEVCQRRFSLKSNVRSHMRVHTGEKPYKCETCQRSFSDNTSLRKHLRLHTGEKPFKCEVCQRSFIERNKLTNHMRVHTGEKPFRCEVCQRRFSLKSNVRSHMRVHTGEKLYKCETCQRSFSDNTSLRKHLRLHTGEKPFKCEVCQLRFRYSTYLKRHKLQIHMAGSTS